jgi:hypothetical protein
MPQLLLGATKCMNNNGSFVISVKDNVTTEQVLNKSSLHSYHCNYALCGLRQFVIGYKYSTWNIRACSTFTESEHRLSQIWGFYSGDYEECDLLGCDAV